MASHREIEVKLRTEPAKIAKIRRSPWWRGLERLHRKSLHSVYYDTSDHRLRDCHISLRTRNDGHSFVQTLKMSNGASDSLVRAEWETVVPDAIPDPSLVIDPALPDDFRKHEELPRSGRGATLHPGSRWGPWETRCRACARLGACAVNLW
jgi:inorganic triphosphatase YgiF